MPPDDLYTGWPAEDWLIWTACNNFKRYCTLPYCGYSLSQSDCICLEASSSKSCANCESCNWFLLIILSLQCLFFIRLHPFFNMYTADNMAFLNWSAKIMPIYRFHLHGGCTGCSYVLVANSHQQVVVHAWWGCVAILKGNGTWM